MARVDDYVSALGPFSHPKWQLYFPGCAQEVRKSPFSTALIKHKESGKQAGPVFIVWAFGSVLVCILACFMGKVGDYHRRPTFLGFSFQVDRIRSRQAS